MGKKDIATKQYMRDPQHFADFFNGYFYNGQEVIDWTTLEEIDASMISIVPTVSGRRGKSVQKYRDIIKRSIIMHNSQSYYAILGIENQSDIHYAMPVRNMLYDALAYTQQVEEISAVNKAEGNLAGSEYLSGFSRTDKLNPVYTATLYWGSAPWDGPVALSDMLRDVSPTDQQFLNDYNINLFSIIDRDEFPEYKTELGLLFSLLNSRNSDEKLQDLVQSNEAFQHISRETAELMRDYASLRLPRRSKEGDYNMCKAVQEIERKSKEEGRLEGIEENKVESIRMVMQNFKVTAEQAMEGLGIPKSEYKKYLTML